MTDLRIEKARKEQRMRLTEVLDLLKEQGVSQAIIAKSLDCEKYDEAYISSLKSGKIKNIPEDFLENLHEKFKVNPDYIRGISPMPFDIIGEQFEHFQKFSPQWTTVTHGDSKFLYFTMDGNFYKFLIEAEGILRQLDSGNIDVQTELENLKKLYLAKPDYKKFVVLPCDEFINIISDSNREREQLSEVVDLVEQSAKLNEEE